MGVGCNPEELARVAGMVKERIGVDWLVLRLPDRRYAALWAQGLAGDHGRGVANGDYSGCYAIGTLREVRAAARKADAE